MNLHKLYNFDHRASSVEMGHRTLPLFDKFPHTVAGGAAAYTHADAWRQPVARHCKQEK